LRTAGFTGVELIMNIPARRGIVILALTLAGAVPGCEAYSTVRRCGPQGCPADQQITSDIRALLAQHAALLPPNLVYVRTLDGVVYLSGQVATPLQRSEAEDLARQPVGVRRVVNNIAFEYRG
jgi:osmotically-inducible protein OsmY